MTKSGNNIDVKWAHVYKIHGESSFDEKKNNRCYSKKFKLKVSQEYLNGTGSVIEIVNYCLDHDKDYKTTCIKMAST